MDKRNNCSVRLWRIVFILFVLYNKETRSIDKHVHYVLSIMSRSRPCHQSFNGRYEYGHKIIPNLLCVMC